MLNKCLVSKTANIFDPCRAMQLKLTEMCQDLQIYLALYSQSVAILIFFSDSYEDQTIAPCCGGMLRECIRFEPLAKIILYSEQFYDFFTYVELSTFDVASDAFATFKVLQVYICRIYGTVPKFQHPKRDDVCHTIPRFDKSRGKKYF